MKNRIKSTYIWHLLTKIYRILAPLKPESLQFSAQQWNEEYQGKKWDYLEDINELGRYSAITGYISHLKPNASILEIGCGTGLLFNRLKHLPYERYKGIDISESAIKKAAEYSDEKTVFVAGDGASHFDGSKYDVIVFNEALYYFDDCIKVLNHYLKCLNPGGFFIISMVVGDISQRHWRNIDTDFNVVDGVQIINQRGITWNCRVVQPKVKETYASPTNIVEMFVLQVLAQSTVAVEMDACLLSLLQMLRD